MAYACKAHSFPKKKRKKQAFYFYGHMVRNRSDLGMHTSFVSSMECPEFSCRSIAAKSSPAD
jgi:hypothetical protein